MNLFCCQLEQSFSHLFLKVRQLSATKPLFNIFYIWHGEWTTQKLIRCFCWGTSLQRNLKHFWDTLFKPKLTIESNVELWWRTEKNCTVQRYHTSYMLAFQTELKHISRKLRNWTTFRQWFTWKTMQQFQNRSSSRIWVIYIQHSLQIEQQVTTGHFHIWILVIFSSSLGSNSWQVSNLFDTPKSGGHLLTKVQHPIFSRLNFNGITHPIMWPDLTQGAWLCTGVFQWQQFVKQDMSPRALYSLFSFLRWLRWRVLLNLLILMVIRKTSNWSWPFWALLYFHCCRRPSQAHYCIASWNEHELQNSCSGRFANSLDQVYTSDEGFLKVEFTRTFMFSTTLWVCTFSHDAGWNS